MTALSSLIGVTVFFGLSFLALLTGVSGTMSDVFAAAVALAASLLAGVVFGGLSSAYGH